MRRRFLISGLLAIPFALLLPQMAQADGSLVYCPHGHESCIPLWQMTTQDMEHAVKRIEKAGTVSCRIQESGPQLHRWRCEVLRHGEEGVLFVRVNRSNSVFTGSGRGVRAFVITPHGSGVRVTG
jgi:hypothetical protein